MTFVKLGAILMTFVLIATIAFYTFMGWGVLSLVTSGIKAATGDCGKKYKIEVVLSGDWFCVADNNNNFFND